MKYKSVIRRVWSRVLPDLLPHAVALGVAALAIILILWGLTEPFYTLPEISSEGEFTTRDSELTRYFKITLALITILLIVVLTALVFRGKKPGHLLTRATFLMFLTCATYPTLLVLYDAESVGDGAWLQQQHDTMTWLGGDVYRAHSERSIESGTGVNAQDPPIRLAVFKPPTGSLGMQRLNDWVWWSGYGPSWTQFAGRGWFFISFGFLLLTFALLGTHWRWDIPDARKLFRKLVVQGGLFLSCYALTLGGIYSWCRAELRAAEEATAEGDYKVAYHEMQNAVKAVPSLINDTGIIRQMGYYQWRLGDMDSPESQMYQVHWLDEKGYHDRARDLLNALWAHSVDEMPRHVKREMARHQLRVAVNDLNSGKVNAALGHLDKLLVQEPNCIQGLFHKQLASLQGESLAEVRETNRRLVTLYDGYKSKNKRGVIATSYWLLAQAEAKGGNTAKSWQSRKKSKGIK